MQSSPDTAMRHSTIEASDEQDASRATGGAPLRRSQDMRSSETRARLMQATLDMLNSHGYARASLADIARSAGVTRGALHHHFAGKDDLVAQSVGLMLEQATAEIELLALDVSRGRLTLDGFVDRLWQMFSGALFMITLEHVTEARHNTWLKAQLIEPVRQFHASLNGIWQRFFRARGVDAAIASDALNATLCLMRGMGVQSVLRDDPRYYASLIAHWKQQLHALLDGP
jgi:AcrR family transcriptional regulator